MLTNKDNLLNPANPHAGLVYSICVVKFNIKYEPQPLNGEGLNLNLNLILLLNSNNFCVDQIKNYE